MFSFSLMMFPDKLILLAAEAYMLIKVTYRSLGRALKVHSHLAKQ